MTGRPYLFEPPRVRNARALARGRVFIYPYPWSANLARSYVRTTYAHNRRATPWAKYGRYLARDGAQRPGALGRGFTAARDDVDLPRTLGEWQRARDPRLWKFVVSPEQGNRLDLRAHTRALVAQMERDFGTRLEWAAIDHHDTANAHVHVLVRGRDAARRPLEIAPYYFEWGLRARSQELATRALGFRSEGARLAGRGRSIAGLHFTEIDRVLRELAGDRGLLTYDAPPSRARGGDQMRLQDLHRLQDWHRLQVLERLGLAQKTGARTWRLAPTFERTLRRAPVEVAYRNLVRRRRERALAREGRPRPGAERHRLERPRERAR